MTPRTLNGWQRLWIVLMLLWALPVFAVGYSSFPRYLYHSYERSGHSRNHEVAARMTTETWEGDACKIVQRIELGGRTFVADNDTVPRGQVYLGKNGEPLPGANIKDLAELKAILERMLAAGESDANIELVIGYFAAQQLVRVHVPIEGLSPNVVLCFGSQTPQAEIERIAGDYRSAYFKLLKERRLEQVGLVVGYWVIPGVFLYAVGLGVSWIRRGFKTE